MRNSYIRTCVTVVLFLVLGFGIYYNSLNAPFILDDGVRIENNPDIRMTELTFNNIVKAAFGKNSSRNRPFGNITFALNYYFHKYAVEGYHVVNIMIHILAGIFLYFFLVATLQVPGTGKRELVSDGERGREDRNPDESGEDRLLSHKRVSSHTYLIALLAVLVWLVHPLHTQSITYIVQRLNSLAAMLFILSFLFYVRGRISFRKKNSVDSKMSTRTTGIMSFFGSRSYYLWFTGSILVWILSLGCKQITVTLPFFIFLYEYYFFQNMDRDWLVRNLKILAGVVILFGIIAFIFLGSAPLEKIASLNDFSNNEFTIEQRILTQLRVVIYYLSLVFFPHPSRLNLDYDFPLSHSLIDPLTTILSLGGIIVILGLACYLARERRLLSFCIFWFFGNLVIESSIIPLAIIYEHRTYLPSMLIPFLAVLLIFRYIRIGSFRIIILCIIIAFFSFWTYQRNKVWQDAVSLWSDCAKKSPHKARIYCALGNAYIDKERIDRAISNYSTALEINPLYAEAHVSLGALIALDERYDEAIEHFTRALRVRPRYPKALNLLGLSLSHTGRLEDALSHYSRALKIDPLYADAHKNMGIGLIRKGNQKKAIHHLSEALKIKPDLPEAHNGLGAALSNLGRYDDALDHYSRALEITPEYPEAHYGKGMALAYKKMYDKAIRQYIEALRIKPDYTEAHTKLGIVYTYKGNLEDASVHFSEALRIDPANADAYMGLGVVLTYQGNLNEAIEKYSDALRIDPDHADSHFNMGAVFHKMGRYEEAARHFKEVLRINPGHQQAKKILDTMVNK